MNFKEVMVADSAILLNTNELASVCTYKRYQDASEYPVAVVITLVKLNDSNDGRGLPTSYNDNATGTFVTDFKPELYDEIIDENGEAWKVGNGMTKVANRWRVDLFKKEKPTGFGSVPRY